MRDRRYHVIRIRRRPCASWMGWFLWLIALALLLEFAVMGFLERESQSGAVSGAMFVGLLLAGLIIEGIKTVESRSVYRDLPASGDGSEAQENADES